MGNHKGGAMSSNLERGFSMLEVLVSMLVIMIGALGIAGMQLLAITSTENARYQNVATMLGATLTANMQANVAYWGTPPLLINVTGATNTGGPAAFAGQCTGLTISCNATQMAGYDLREWGKEVARLLPSGTAAISCPTGNNPAICQVVLSWKERNVSLQDVTETEPETEPETETESENTLQSGKRVDNTYQTLVSIL